MWTRGKNGLRFQRAEFLESSEELANPGCGWYHIYPFVIRIPSELSLEETQLCISDISKDERLVLALIDIGAFRSCAIPNEALEDISRVFELFRVNQKQMIVRFAYDSEGRGMEREPQNIALVKRHMEQLGDIICAFSDDILVLQGIFVGNWGEMHHSKFLTVPYMAELMDCLYRAVKGSCYLAVRTPEQWRGIMGYGGTDQALSRRMGLFNDGMFGSPTDLGTYREASRQEELEWQSSSVAFVPNGGEALAGERRTGYRQAAKEMEQMHLCYLNSSYQREQLNHWRQEQVKQRGCWNGLSGWEYIGRHLGSRFVVRGAKLSGGQLEVAIENRGFAGFYEEAECLLVLEEESGETECQLIAANVLDWESGKRVTLRIPLPDTVGEARLFFQVRRKRDKRPLRFGNQNAGDRVLLGVLKHR